MPCSTVFLRRRYPSRIIHNSAHRICSGTVNDGLLSIKFKACISQLKSGVFDFNICLCFILFKHTVCPGSVPFLTQETTGVRVLSSVKPKLLPSKKSMYILHWFCCLLRRIQLLQSSPFYLKVNLENIIPLVWR